MHFLLLHLPLSLCRCRLRCLRRFLRRRRTGCRGIGGVRPLWRGRALRTHAPIDGIGGFSQGALLGALNVFARLDWYADARRGPLLGEITLTPNMGQSPALLTGWVNRHVAAHWHGADGAPPRAPPGGGGEAAAAEALRKALRIEGRA